MSESDLIRIEHMIAAAKEALAFLADRTAEDLATDRMLARSLERQIEIVGEAAGKVSEELRSSSPHIPWPDIVSMRNRLIHAYFDVDLRIVWSTVTSDFPALIVALLDLIAPEPTK